MGVFLFLITSCSSSSSGENKSVKEVKVETMRLDSVEIPLRQPAQLRGKQDIAIVPQVSATIEQVLVQEGDRVVEGQRMFILQQTAYCAAVESARAQVASAEASLATEELQLDAKRQLLDKSIISNHEFKVQQNRVAAAEASLSEAKAALTKANNDLGYTVICAPHTGVVGSINYKQGALVSPQISEPMTIVSDNSTVYAYISITGERYMYLLSEFGSKEELIRQIPEFSLILGGKVYYNYSGRLETVSGIIDQSTGAVSMRVAFPNPDGLLTSGGSGTAELKFLAEAITLPRNAVFSIQDKNYVYVVEQTDSTCTLRQTSVEVERLSDRMYIIEKGLDPGQVVVVEGVKKLTNGEVVKIAK